MTMELEDKKRVADALSELIKIAKEREIVRKLLNSDDVWWTWDCESIQMRGQLKELGDSIRATRLPVESYVRYKPPFKRLPSFIDEENIVEFCIGLMMLGYVDEKEIVLEWLDVIMLLEKVTGEFEPLAKTIKEFLNEEYISDYYDVPKELVKIIFS